MSKSPDIEAPTQLVLCALTAADLMTPSPVSLNAAATVKEAAAFLTERGVSAAPVIDEAGHPVGVVSRSDIVAHDRGCGQTDYYERVELTPVRMTWTDFDVLESGSAPISDIMTPVVFSVPPETPAHKVIEELQAQKVHRLFVVDRTGVLVGVISTIDVLRNLRRQEAEAVAPCNDGIGPGGAGQGPATRG